MLKRIMIFVLMLAVIAMPAIGESSNESTIEKLEQRVAELEKENTELRALLSEKDSARLVAARFNGGVITVDEAKAEYEYRVYFYEGMNMDESEYEDIIKEEVLNDLTEDAILKLKAQELGVFEPSADEAVEIAARAQANLDEMIEYYLAFQTDPEKTEEENREAVIKFLADEGTTLESLVETMNAQSWRDRLLASATEAVQLSDEQLRKYYDEACETAELTYSADPSAYETDCMNGEAVLWNPEGYRNVKRLLVAFDENSAQRMLELSEQLENTSSESEISALLEEMDTLYTKLDTIVSEVQSRIEAGDDFNLLLDEYGADPFIQTEYGRENGYCVSATHTLLDAEFVSEAMALEAPGDVSGAVECADGIYILCYESDVVPGTVDYDTFLSDESMRTRVIESARNEHYYEQVEKWLEDSEIEFYPENF